MVATKNTELPNHVVDIGKTKLLKVAAIYGANASGKSNVYSAFEYMSFMVLNSFNFGGSESDRKGKSYAFVGPSPFLLDDLSKSEPSLFEVFFIDNQDESEKTYQYGFVVDQSEIVEEWLFSKAKSSKEFRTIFYRKRGEKIDFSGLKKAAENIEIALEKESLVVSLGAKLKISVLKFVRDWFLKNEMINYGNPGENYMRSRSLPHGFENDDVQKKVVEYFSIFDSSIKDFKIEEVEYEK